LALLAKDGGKSGGSSISVDQKEMKEERERHPYKRPRQGEPGTHFLERPKK